MKKEEIINAELRIIEWGKSLLQTDNNLWFTSFSDGKWATADVISHLINWDRFFLEQRIPYIIKKVPFPNLEVDEDKMNDEAAIYARSGVTKEQLIKEFIETRQQVISILEDITESEYGQMLIVGERELSLANYLLLHIEHDLKHQTQIDDFLKNR